MALRSGSLDTSGQPWSPGPSHSCLQGRVDISHLPREGTEAASGSIQPREPDRGAPAGLIVLSWHFGTGYCLAPNELFCN